MTFSRFASVILMVAGLATNFVVIADEARDQIVAKLRALNWVRGPSTVTIANNSTLAVPEGFVFLDAHNTKRFLELNENLTNGREVMLAPDDLSWSAYFEFEESGYVKDDEKIDSVALLKTLHDNTEAANEERRKRGWRDLHVVDWATPPGYNSTTKRLEWATTLESEGHRSVNFFTKVLGRRGVTSVQMVSSPEDLLIAETSLAGALDGFKFNAGETYAEWKPGEKVAEYGLAALIVGGVAAVATKKGFWGIAGAFLAGAWKFLVAGFVAAFAWLKSLFKKKT